MRRSAALAVLAAGAYPWLLDLAHKVARGVSYREEFGVLAPVVLATFLMFLAPTQGFRLLLSLARGNASEPRLRAVVLLVLLTPPLFTLVGVETWLSGLARSENGIWLAFWLGISIAALRSAAPDKPDKATHPLSARWRISHGFGALLLLVGFLALHIANHELGLIGADAHLTVMQTLRHWYRNGAVEPVLLLLCALQIVTGAVLARRWLARSLDAARTLQVATGAYLGLYLVCHLNSVFVYARANGIATDFWFASGGPAGLMGDAWNVRLIPHYALAVLFLFVHLGAGLRVVLLAHGRNRRWLMHAAWGTGALAALGAVLPLLRIHLS